MSKPSRRPNREARKEHKAKLKAARKELRKRQREQGLEEPPQSGYNNSQCPWKTVEEEQGQGWARQWGIDRCLYLTLYFAKILMGSEVSDTVLTALEPADLSAEMLELAEKRFFSERHRSVPILSVLTELKHTKSIYGKARLIGKLLLPTKDFMHVKFKSHPEEDSFRVYLSYLHRILHYVSKYTHTVWQLITGEKDTVNLARLEQHSTQLRQWLSKMRD
ncbi:MAG TPA: hypothetical protein VJL89_13710 [Thermodesulfovibrionia bacterium]|nr:hypothetical protein [Thermodesulfovibrionia bacterium]